MAKRTVEATLPDGTVVTRTSESRIYTHVAVAKNGAGNWKILGFSSSYAFASKAAAQWPTAHLTERQVLTVTEVEKRSKGSKSMQTDIRASWKAHDEARRAPSSQPEPEPTTATSGSTKGARTMAITDRNLAAGTKLWAKHKGTMHTAEVVGTDDGLRYRLADGRDFKSPSAAGSAIFGTDSKGKPRTCNGWAFWTVGEPPAEKAPRAPRSSKPKPEGAEDDESSGQALPIIKTLDDRFECGECAETFGTRKLAMEHIAEKHPVLIAA